MFIVTYLISGFTLILREILETTLLILYFLLIIDIFYLSGEPISVYLLRYDGLAVEYHSFARHALHLHQSRLVNNSGLFYWNICHDYYEKMENEI